MPCAIDADRLPRAPAARRGGHAGRAVLHRGQRRPLPRRRRGARDRGAGRGGARAPLHRGPRRLAPPVLGRPGARRPRCILRLRARADRPAPRHRGRLPRRARGPHGEPAGAPTTGTTSSARCTSCATRRSITRTTTSGTVRTRPTACGSATSRRSARPRAAGCSTSSPTPTSSRSGAASARAPRATCGASTSARWTGSPRRGSRSRSRPPGCASRSASSIPRRAFLEMCLEAGCPVALSSDAHVPEHIGSGTSGRSSCSRGSASTELAVFERRERRLEPIG